MSESLRARSSSSLDISLTAHLRLTVTDGSKIDSTISGYLQTLLQFGEVQQIDMSRFQFDRSVSVSYFDIRAAALARKTIANGECVGLTLNSAELVDSSSQSMMEYVPLCCNVSARSVEIIGFPSGEMVNECNEFLLTVFNRFGEVETISYNGKDMFKVLFFDYRSPLAVLGALQGPCKEWSEKVVVSSEQLVTLLLAGTQAAHEPVPQAPRSPTKLTRSSTPPEFLINLRDIEKGTDLRTTVMIRNIPRHFSQAFLIECLEKRMSPGLSARPFFDFLYLPLDLGTSLNVGYAFVNLTEPRLVIQLFNRFNNKRWSGAEDAKGTAKVTFARIQGFEQLLQHFNRSSIMNQPDSIRPYFSKEI